MVLLNYALPKQKNKMNAFIFTNILFYYHNFIQNNTCIQLQVDYAFKVFDKYKNI